MYSFEVQKIVQENLASFMAVFSTANESVDIIMPVYNAAKTLAKTLQYIQNQSHKNWKLIAVDDGSTDNSCEILKATQDPRITVLRLNSNSGPSEARNTALRLAKSNYIAFCDSDDLWVNRDHLTESIVFLMATCGDICYSSASHESLCEGVFEDGSPAFMWIEGDGKQKIEECMDYDKLLHRNWIYISSVVMKNGLNLWFDKAFDSIEDWDYWLKALEQQYSIYYLNRKHIDYLVKTNGMAGVCSEEKRQKLRSRKCIPSAI
jgi:glycosyltransferase involved in cell wall biosynthesis